MISFPPLLPDELLYSTFARYHGWSGNENYRKTMRDLFSSMNVCAVTDLPCHLQLLSERIPGKSINVSEILWNHTLLAYYAPFMGRDRLFRVEEEMRLRDGRSLYMKMGLPASGVKNNKTLQFCQACVDSDREKFGVAYWHRSHQLPGVKVCHNHHLYLNDSPVLFSQPRNKHEYVSLDSIIDTIDFSVDAPQLCKDNRQLEFAEISYQLINVGTKIRSCVLNGEKMYMASLNNKGLLFATGGKAFTRIVPAIQSYWGDEMLIQIGSNFDPNSNHSWLHKMLRKQRHEFHPARHLLLHGFLGMDINESLIGRISELNRGPFGKAPWICLNRAAEHFMEPIIQDLIISRCSSTGKPVGTFSCACGFIYSRRGPDTTESDKYRIGRIKKFGDLWMNRLIDWRNYTKIWVFMVRCYYIIGDKVRQRNHPFGWFFLLFLIF